MVDIFGLNIAIIFLMSSVSLNPPPLKISVTEKKI